MIIETVKRVLSGDREAYGEIVQAYQDMLLSYTGFRLPDRDLVDEVVHLTFLRAYSQLAEYDSGKDFGAWLRTIAKFVLMTEIKKSIRDRQHRQDAAAQLRSRVAEAALESSGQESEADTLRALEFCLNGLREPHRTLIRTRYGRNASVQELARQFGHTVTWVTTTLFRLRGILRQCLREKTGRTVTT